MQLCGHMQMLLNNSLEQYRPGMPLASQLFTQQGPCILAVAIYMQHECPYQQVIIQQRLAAQYLADTADTYSISAGLTTAAAAASSSCAHPNSTSQVSGP